MWGSLAYGLLQDIAVIYFILVLLDYGHWLLVITHTSLSAGSFPVESTHLDGHAVSSPWTIVLWCTQRQRWAKGKVFGINTII